MANVSSVGIGSGVLTSDLIDKLVAAEREPVEQRLDFKQAEIDAELSLFGQIQSAITDFRLPSRSLANPTVFSQMKIESSSGAFNATVTGKPSAGNYSLEVSQLATAHSLSTAEFADKDTTTLGEGTLDITVNGSTTSIAIGPANNTLEGIAAAINEQSDVAITASVINTGGGFKLVISSDETGIENKIDISVTDTGDGLDDEFGLSQLSYTAGAERMTQNQEALDASFKFNNIAITRASNTFDDVVEGVTIDLVGTNAGSASTLKVKRDASGIVEKVQEFVDKFNALQKLIADNSVFNPDNPAANGLLLGDSATRTIMNRIQGILGQTIKGLESASVRSVAELGISTNKDTGQLSFDSDEFLFKLADDPESVAAIFADQGRTSDGQVEFYKASSKTKVGTYDINVTQIATKGELGGTVALGGATVINADNDELSFKIDGVSTSTLTLAAGTYTNAELAAELQSKINGDAALKAAGKSVTVTVDGSNQLVINSNSFGSLSKVEVLSVDTNTELELGLAVGAGTDGLDVAGTINGKEAGGLGQYLVAAIGDDAEGLGVKITGGATGDRGTVSYIEGVGEQMVDQINSFLTVNGTITAKNERLNSQLEQIAKDRAKLETRVQSLNERLVRQFTSADILIAKLNSTQDFVKAQLDALAGINKKD